MESIILMSLLAALAWYIYKTGKRIGSIKGYNVGRSRVRRGRRR